MIYPLPLGKFYFTSLALLIISSVGIGSIGYIISLPDNKLFVETTFSLSSSETETNIIYNESWDTISLPHTLFTLSPTSTTSTIIHLHPHAIRDNYTFKLSENDTLILYDYFIDTHNFYTCTFSSNKLSIQQTINGDTRVLRFLIGDFNKYFKNKNTNFRTKIDKNGLSCLINNKVLLSQPTLNLNSTYSKTGFSLINSNE